MSDPEARHSRNIAARPQVVIVIFDSHEAGWWKAVYLSATAGEVTGADTSVRLGAFLEVIIAIAIIGTAVTLFPIVKRQNEGFALGYVAARVLESIVIVVGIISLLSVVTLRQDLAGAAGADAALLVTAGKSLVAVHDWTFLLGPGLMPGVNGVLVGYLMYTSRLVPQPLALLGLVGGPLLFASGIAVLLGVIEAGSVWQGISTLPVAAFEVLLSIWLIVKGFNPSVIASEKFRLRPAQP